MVVIGPARAAGSNPKRLDKKGRENPVKIATSTIVVTTDEALEGLAAHDQLAADVAKLRYFTGLTNEETGKALNVSPATAKRHWRYARAWLLRAIDAGKQ